MGIYKDKRELTKNIIMDAFWSLYQTKGLTKISIKEITDKAGYNRTTFYVHFKDVEDVLYHIEQKVITEYKASAVVEDIGNNRRAANAKKYAEFLHNNSKYFPKLLMASRDSTFPESFKQILKGVIKELIVTPELKERLKNEILLEYIASGIIGCLCQWHENKFCSIEELCKTIDALIINSLSIPLVDYDGEKITR